MTTTTLSPATATRGRAAASPADLERPCARCGHQNGPERSRTGWPIYDPMWRDALGACAAPGCTCPSRTDDPTAAAGTTPQAAPITPPPPVPTRLPGHAHPQQ